MQDLEPPEVPLEMVPKVAISEPKKVGFLKRLFSKKDSSKTVDESSTQRLPELTLPQMDLPAFNLSSPNANGASSDFDSNMSAGVPVLPSVTDQFNEFKSDLETLESGKIKNKSKGKVKKGEKRKINHLDESSQFDWQREVRDQEILIHDSNRFNQDANLLMTQADAHIEEQTRAAANDLFSSEHKDIPSTPQSMNIAEPNINLTKQIPEMNQQMPLIDEDQRKTFMQISISHQRLKSQLEKSLKNKKLFNNKEKMLKLFELYDENVEKRIEDKELELTKKKLQLDRFEKHLKGQEKNILDTHAYIKELDEKLKNRETDINKIIAQTVEKELTRRLKIDKKALQTELNKTKELNEDLKKKVKIIENDRVRFEREHQRMSDMERKKLTELQTLYEKKLKELDAEKKIFTEEKRTFAEKRKNVLALVSRADAVSRDLEEIEKAKTYVDTSKKFVENELVEDKELKTAIASAETSLVREKENLDNMIFSKYINNKLKSIKPEYLDKRQDWKTALKSNPLYAQISECRNLLGQRKITDAKTLYNNIRKAYEEVQATKSEKEALYTAIRELYNDIQLKLVEAQIHVM